MAEQVQSDIEKIGLLGEACCGTIIIVKYGSRFISISLGVESDESDVKGRKISRRVTGGHSFVEGLKLL